jgi:hypothetical protein
VGTPTLVKGPAGPPHLRFGEPTHPDVLTFHELFADIVVRFRHFTTPMCYEAASAALGES